MEILNLSLRRIHYLKPLTNPSKHTVQERLHTHTQRKRAWARADKKERAQKSFFLRTLSYDWSMCAHINQCETTYHAVCVGLALGFQF